MSRAHRVLLMAFFFGVFLLSGCAEETSQLKQKISDLEKKLQKQERDLREFAERLAPPRDFSADIQRIEDQQERFAQIIKTRVDPINNKLEEFRDWAQETQKGREELRTKLGTIEHALGDIESRYGPEVKDVARFKKEYAAEKKNLAVMAKNVESLNRGLAEIRKEVVDNNTKLIEAVKKTLPKVKSAAVAEIAGRITPLEEGLMQLKTGLDTDRRTMAAAIRTQVPIDSGGREAQTLRIRLKELEEIVASQKTFMLEMGSKIHELEKQLRRLAAGE